VALNHSKRRGHGSLNKNEKNAAFGFMKGRRFQDATFESALDATSQALHAARLKDLVRSLNAKSAFDDWGLVSPDVSRSGNPRVSSSLGLDINIFKCQVGVDDLGLASSMLLEAAIHVSALHWALTFVRELRLMALVFTPLITGLMGCL